MTDTATKPGSTKPATAKTPARKAATPKAVGAKRAPMRRSTGKATLLGGPLASRPGLLPLDRVDTDRYTNPRGPVVRDEAFDELAASIRELGVLQPILVGPAGDDGRHPLVAGWSRTAAASVAGLATIPVHEVGIADAKAALVAAIAENVARRAMSPMAEANALDQLVREHGYSQVQAGKTIGMAERTVRERLRLVRLHAVAPKAAAAIDTRLIPMDAAPRLDAIAKIAPAVADALADLVADKTITGTELADPEETGACLHEVAARRPDIFLADITSRARLDEARTEALGLTDAQVSRWEAIPREGTYYPRAPELPVHELQAAAREAGVILEATNEYAVTTVWVTDREWLAPHLEALLVKAEAAGARRKAKEAGEKPPAPARPTGEAKEAADKVRTVERLERERAHQHNSELGERLAAGALVQHTSSLAAVKAIALLAVADDARVLVSRGLRYCQPGALTETIAKNGTAKRTYDGERIDLVTSIENARSVDEVLEIVTTALVTAEVADQGCVAQSHRGYHQMHSKAGVHVRSVVATSKIREGLAARAVARAKAFTDGGPVGLAAYLAGGSDGEASTPTSMGPVRAAALAKPPRSASPRSPGKRRATPAAIVALLRKYPGLSIPEIAGHFGQAQNMFYRLLPELQKDGKVRKDGRGWHATGTTGS